MRTSRNHMKFTISAVSVVFAASIVAAAVASTGSNHSTSARANPTSVRTLSTTQHAALIRRANRFRILAHREILRRNAELHGRRVAAATAPDPLALAAMRDMAIEISSLNGEASPQRGQVFASTRKFAQTVIDGDTVDTDQPVFVAVLHGNFVGYLASVPIEGQFPTGDVLTITFDANTLAVTDWGLVPVAPDTTRLGTSTSLGF